MHNITFKHKTLRAHVSAMRKQYRADLVTLVSSKDGGGVGWLLTNLKGSRRTGYNVLGAGALRGYTLAHEVGHNLGCQHARGDSGVSRGLFPHGHGHRFTASKDQGRARQYRIPTLTPSACQSRRNEGHNAPGQASCVSRGLKARARRIDGGCGGGAGGVLAAQRLARASAIVVCSSASSNPALSRAARHSYG